MKRTLVSLALVAGLGTAAQASDLNGSLKDGGSTFTPSSVNWTGFYIGGSLGYGHANHELSIQQYNGSYCYDEPTQPTSAYDEATTFGDHYAIPANGICAGSGTDNIDSTTSDVIVPSGSETLERLDGLSSSGLVGDGRIGFDLQRGRFLFGVFGSYGFSNMETETSNVNFATLGSLAFDSIEKDHEWSVGARAGVLVNPRTLAYILAAYTQADYTFGGTDSSGATPVGFTHDVTFSGVTVGGGVEFALTQNVFLGVEGTHTFFGKETIADLKTGVDGADAGQRFIDEIGETKVMGTLKVKLNGGLGGALE